jgi:transposase
VKGKATEKMNLMAGLLDHEIIAPLMYDINTHAGVFNAWLEQSLIPALPPHSIIVLDNAQFHKTVKTKEIVSKHGHLLLFLPPYSPDLNPIENYWALIKRKVKKLLPLHDDLSSCIEMVFQTN